jgi:hypothetical protein
MSGVLRGSTPRALVVILVLPLDESLANTAFGRGMLGDPSPAGRLQGFHAGPTSVPVDNRLGIIGESLVSDPVELGDGILDGFVQAAPGWGCQFAVATPDGPTLVVDGNVRGLEGWQQSFQVAIEELGSGIHFTVQCSQPCVGVSDFAILVAVHMHRVPGDG